MALRDLFCVLEATEDAPKAALSQAVALARGYGAQAAFTVAASDIVVPSTFLSASVVGAIVDEESKKVRQRGNALRDAVRQACAEASVAARIQIRNEPFADLLDLAKGWARCHDLVVIERPGPVLEHGQSLFEEMLFGTGRPVLIAAPGREPVQKIRSIVLAWDGSANAARALGSTLGLFPDLKQAEVLVVTGEKDLSGAVPGDEIAHHIDRHGAKARVVDLPVESAGVAATLDNYAKESGADLIVMGGFVHSRWREFVLGGVTRELSKNTRTPLLLAH